jgi:DNA processing protein
VSAVGSPIRADPRRAAAQASPPDRVLTPDDPRYPKALLLLEKPPRRLWARGDVAALDAPAVAIVGSRTPTNYGIRVAYEAAREAARAGLVVVSGMARGLDARAHRGALDAGGRTIGVLGCGLDVAYPRTNTDLLSAIPASGLLLTELPPGRRPEKWTFPARNRIVAALSKCVLVVEGRRAGGTDNTAWWMLRLGRRVLAVPGRIDEVVAEGPNRLIQDGATPYLTPQDLLREFGLSWVGTATGSDESGEPAGPRRAPSVPSDRRRDAGLPGKSEGTGAGRAAARRPGLPPRGGGGSDPAPLDPEVLEALSGLAAAEAAVFDVVTPGGEHVDRLAERCGLAPAPLLAALSSLELKGLVTQLPGKRFRLAS